MNNKRELLLGSERGVYIPKDFIEIFDFKAWHIDEIDADILKRGPYDNELYWEVWHHNVVDKAYIYDGGYKWTLYQDGDLFALREDLTDEEFEEWSGV